jgi:hypothetical protein
MARHSSSRAAFRLSVQCDHGQSFGHPAWQAFDPDEVGWDEADDVLQAKARHFRQVCEPQYDDPEAARCWLMTLECDELPQSTPFWAPRLSTHRTPRVQYATGCQTCGPVEGGCHH